MKSGLSQLPQLADLEKAYHDFLLIQRPGSPLMESDQFALYSQWSRFDSRLGEICVSYLILNWKRLHPLDLRTAFLKQPWPAILGVFLEFSQKWVQGKEDFQLFKKWMDTATTEIPKANWEQFFIGKRRIAGNAMLEDARFSTEEYRKWGYLSREILINKGGALNSKASVSGLSYSPATRVQILKELSRSQSRITVEMYRIAVGLSVSKRQAERDLLQSSILVPVGNTKGRYFAVRPSHFRKLIPN